MRKYWNVFQRQTVCSLKGIPTIKFLWASYSIHVYCCLCCVQWCRGCHNKYIWLKIYFSHLRMTSVFWRTYLQCLFKHHRPLMPFGLSLWIFCSYIVNPCLLFLYEINTQSLKYRLGFSIQLIQKKSKSLLRRWYAQFSKTLCALLSTSYLLLLGWGVVLGQCWP